MSGTRPVAAYAMRIPPGDILVPAVPDFAPMFRVTMAAIDPSEEPQLDAADEKQKPRATLKIVRVPEDMIDDSEDDEDFEDEDDSEDELVNGGPSVKKALKKLAEAEGSDEDDDEDMEGDSEEDAVAEALLAKIMKGKSKALEGEDDDEDDEDSESDESLGMDECVICTLDPEKTYQQPLDFHVAEGERVFFKVSGSLTVHLTGNYVMPIDDVEDDEDDEYDLSPDEDELDGLDALADGVNDSDDLDDLEDPRIMEVDSEEEKPKKAAATKGKNKRPAVDDEEEEASLDNIMAKSLKKEEPASEQPKKLSKAEKKAAKKLKNNEGEAAAAPEQAKKDTNGSSSDAEKKKVQFAKNLEQGPTPSKADAKADKKSGSGSLGVKDVKGVTVDDRKLGSGPAAKKGSRLEMRYIGKLDNGKVFDSNKSGKPFSFKLGVGEVIQGWDVGLAGISAGGERRLIIPANLAYGKRAMGKDIPANSRLTFDIKCLSVK